MKRLAIRILLSLVVLIAMVATIAYVARNREHLALDDAARRGAPGKFIKLSNGVTQYELTGPDSARTMVLLNGATVPFYMWDSTRVALLANGFRVLRYNYYGRGLSDRPNLAYSLATYDGQLMELLDSLNIRGPVDVAGISMGGPIAANFADQHPDRTRTVTLFDPAFHMLAETPWPVATPVLGEFLMRVFVAPGMAAGQLTDLLHPERFPDWVSRYEPQMQYKGFARSMLHTIRGDVMTRTAGSFTTLAKNSTPMLMVWGKEDHTVPFAKSDTARSAFPRAEFHAIDDAGHLPQMEQAATVDSLLIHFLRAHP